MANKLEHSEEMINLYRTLALVQTNAIFSVMSGKDETEIKERAKEVTGLLREALPQEVRANLAAEPKCGGGTTFDPVTQRCKPNV